uniref:GNAT family N-acetyltransferase n=1 Tax=Falsiroseomonas oryzae TaxID=2766473 RepID=UPI0022EB1AAD
VALRLRSAGPADAAALAALHLASWRDAYRGVLDDAFLDGPLEAILAAHWPAMLAPPRRQGAVVLASIAGEPAGFVAVWRYGRVAHIDNLHVRPGLRGAGIGRALLVHALRRMQARGCVAADLLVFARNAGALRFYRALGAEVGPEHLGETFGQRVAEHRCAWADIAALIAAAERRS